MPVEEKDAKNYLFLTNSKANKEPEEKDSKTSPGAGFYDFYIPNNQTFRPAERLKSNQEIAQVIQHGVSHKNYPLLLHFLQVDCSEQSTYPAKVAFTVPKRRFKKAVTRNRLKRLLRESYRQLKKDFYMNMQKPLRFHLVFVYIGKENVDLRQIMRAMTMLLNRITDE